MAEARAKKAVNVSISADLLEAARGSDINISATLEAALHDELRRRRRDEWLSRNSAGIKEYNRDVEGHGVFSDAVRGF